MPEPIYETVVTTQAADGTVHVAPMGVRYVGDGDVLLMPFKPSTTLANVLATGRAVLNVLTDVRVFAGCVSGARREWPTLPVEGGVRLACALGHASLALREHVDDAQRPRLRLARVAEGRHGDFRGFNRAQAAVIEAAVLVSRLHLLAAEKVDSELRHLQIAIDKTAGPEELEAWAWLRQAVARHRAATPANDR